MLRASCMQLARGSLGIPTGRPPIWLGWGGPVSRGADAQVHAASPGQGDQDFRPVGEGFWAGGSIQPILCGQGLDLVCPLPAKQACCSVEGRTQLPGAGKGQGRGAGSDHSSPLDLPQSPPSMQTCTTMGSVQPPRPIQELGGGFPGQPPPPPVPSPFLVPLIPGSLGQALHCSVPQFPHSDCKLPGAATVSDLMPWPPALRRGWWLQGSLALGAPQRPPLSS